MLKTEVSRQFVGVPLGSSDYLDPKLQSQRHVLTECQRTALIVDDHDLIRGVYRAFLEAEGFAVVEASNGTDALLWLQSTTPDFILLDLDMPVMDGRSFLEYRLCQARIRQIPVLVVSGRLGSATLHQALRRLGADRLLYKPVPREVLIRAVLELPAKPDLPDLLPPDGGPEDSGRKDARVTFTVPLLVLTRASGNAPGNLHDLSAGGLGATLPHLLPQGEHITLRFHVNGCSLSLAGCVQWAEESPTAVGYRHGIRFAESQEETFPLNVYSFFHDHAKGPAAPQAGDHHSKKKRRPRAA